MRLHQHAPARPLFSPFAPSKPLLLLLLRAPFKLPGALWLLFSWERAASLETGAYPPRGHELTLASPTRVQEEGQLDASRVTSAGGPAWRGQDAAGPLAGAASPRPLSPCPSLPPSPRPSCGAGGEGRGCSVWPGCGAGTRSGSLLSCLP